MRRSLLCALLLVACGPPPAPPAAPLEGDDFLLAGIPADADTAEVRLSFGNPDSITQTPNPFEDAPFATWHYPGFEVRFSGAAPVGYLITELGEETARGMRVGDAAAELLRRYGEPSARVDASWTWLEPEPLEHTRILDFLIEADTIRRIYIGRTM